MDWGIYRELAAEERQERALRRQDAEREFAVAKLMALKHGMMLRRNSETHYMLAAVEAAIALQNPVKPEKETKKDA